MSQRPSLMCSTAPFYRQPLREAFRHLAGAGFDAAEVMVTQDPDTREPQMMAGLAREFGIRVEAIHAPFLFVTRRVWGTNPVGKISRAVRLAEQLGAATVIVHPPYRWQFRYRTWLEQSLADFSSSTGVTVAVENMFPIWLPAARGFHVHAARALEDMDRVPHLVLDTSHAAVTGLDVRDVFRRERDRIRHVHLSNNAGKGWDSHLPIDQDGVIPIEGLLRDLVASGYTGGVSLEFDLRPWIGDDVALTDLLVRNRELCERYLAPAKT